MTTDDEFANPSERDDDEQVDNFVWADNKGRLLLIIPAKYETGVATKFGDKDAIRGSVVLLDGPDAGKEYPDTLIFGGVLIAQIKTKIGRKVLGRVGQRPTDKGNPAWVLDDGNDVDRKTARAWLDRNQIADADKPPF